MREERGRLKGNIWRSAGTAFLKYSFFETNASLYRMSEVDSTGRPPCISCLHTADRWGGESQSPNNVGNCSVRDVRCVQVNVPCNRLRLLSSAVLAGRSRKLRDSPGRVTASLRDWAPTRPARPKESIGRCQLALLDEDRSWETPALPFLIRLPPPASVPSTASDCGQNLALSREQVSEPKRVWRGTVSSIVLQPFLRFRETRYVTGGNPPEYVMGLCQLLEPFRSL